MSAGKVKTKEEAPVALDGGVGSAAEQYEAATDRAALVDRSHVGRLSIAGEDALDLLNRLSTNKLEDLDAGEGIYTVLTSNKGRIVDLLFVLPLDGRLLVLTGPGNAARVAEYLDFYTFTEDVAVEDVSEDTAMLALVGSEAAAALGEIAGQDVSSLGSHRGTAVKVVDVDCTLVRTDFLGGPGYDLVVDASESRAARDVLEDRGLRPVGQEAIEAIRVERGVPAFGKELTEDYNPLEANLWDSVSFNKGCYVGQEVVARLNTYDKVQRRLVGLSWDGPASAPSGLFHGSRQVGTLTSAARSPGRGGPIGLGYVRKAQATPGTTLALGSGDGPTATVEDSFPTAPR